MARTYQTSATQTYAWGTLPITFASGSQNGNTFVTDDFETTETTWQAERNDNVGNPAGQLGGVERGTGRATLQIANTNIRAAHRYDEFTAVLRVGENANTYFVTQVGIPRKSRDFDSVPIEFKEKS